MHIIRFFKRVFLGEFCWFSGYRLCNHYGKHVLKRQQLFLVIFVAHLQVEKSIFRAPFKSLIEGFQLLAENFSEFTLHSNKRTTSWFISTRTLDRSLSIRAVLMYLSFVLGGGSKFWTKNLGSKLFIAGHPSCNVSLQFVPRGGHKHPAEHSHLSFLLMGEEHVSQGRHQLLQSLSVCVGQ